MKINKDLYKEIQLLTKNDELIASITDENIICENAHKVVCIPKGEIEVKRAGVDLPCEFDWKKYTCVTVKKEIDGKFVARISKGRFEVAEGYGIEAVVDHKHLKFDPGEFGNPKTMQDIFLNGEDERIAGEVLKIFKQENLAAEAAQYILNYARMRIGETSTLK